MSLQCGTLEVNCPLFLFFFPKAPKPEVSQPKAKKERAPAPPVPPTVVKEVQEVQKVPSQPAADPAPPQPKEPPAAVDESMLKNHEPHLGPKPRSHNKVINPPGGKSSVVFYWPLLVCVDFIHLCVFVRFPFPHLMFAPSNTTKQSSLILTLTLFPLSSCTFCFFWLPAVKKKKSMFFSLQPMIQSPTSCCSV